MQFKKKNGDIELWLSRKVSVTRTSIGYFFDRVTYSYQVIDYVSVLPWLVR